MIRNNEEALEALKDVKSFMKNTFCRIASLEDTIDTQNEFIHHLQEGIKRRDEIIQEKNDQIESLRR